MARELNRLSHLKVKALKEPGLHADGGGLYLEVDPPSKGKHDRVIPGARRWTFVFRWQGKRKQMGLGSGPPIVDLKEAREKTLAARRLLSNRQNPIEVRRASGEAVPTFGAVADEVIVSIEKSDPNPKHLSQWKTSLETHAKALRDKTPATITTEDVLEVLTPIWTTIPETASRTRGRIEHVLDAAKAKGFRSGDNPARWRGHLALLLPKKPKLTQGHHPALPYAKIETFMADLRSREALSARALELTILSATRTRETLGAKWGEFDLEKAVWTIPADRMKIKIEHRVPLSNPAIAMLNRMLMTRKQILPNSELSTALVFSAEDPTKLLSNMAMDMLLRRMSADDATVHGFRSTFRDWAGEETDHPREIIEAALAHVVGTEVERAYRRGDALEKRRKLMEDWASYCGAASSAASHEIAA